MRSARPAAARSAVAALRGYGAIGALATAALLASGCDYWHNLVGDKAVTHASVSIAVKDAWTGKALPFAVCMDRVSQSPQVADASGLINLPDAPTGPYIFTCSQDGYYDTTLRFDQGAVAVNRIAALARLGGADWYPNEADRQGGVKFDNGNTLVPADLTLRAAPYDTSGILRYAWTFANHPELNRPVTSSASAKPLFRIKLTGIPVDSMADTLALKVVARMAGRPDYDVNEVRIPILWIRNRLPDIEFLGPILKDIKIGCPDDQPFNIVYHATDPDGHCESVSFMTLDSSHALGNINVKTGCAGKIALPLNNVFRNYQGADLESTLVDINTLRMSVMDDNHQTRDTVFTLMARPYLLPKITMEKKLAKPLQYENRAAQFRVLAKAPGSRLDRLVLTWGDGKTTTFPYNQSVGSDLDDRLFSHVYEISGLFHFSARLYNECGAVDSTDQFTKEYILIQQNDPPSLKLHDFRYTLKDTLPQLHLHLAVGDNDIAFGMDSLDISISWGDGTPPETYQTHGVDMPDTTLVHPFPTNAAGVVHNIHIRVGDQFDGSIDTVFQVQPYHLP